MKLIVVEQGTRSILNLERGSVRIGRAIDNDVRLAAAQASRHHCKIEHDAQGFWVVDLGSANGTQVNGKRIDRKLLLPGDVVEVGGARIQVEDELAPRADETQRLPDPESPPAVQGRQDPVGETPTSSDDLGSIGLETLSGEARRGRDNLRVFARVTRALAQETEQGPLLRLIVDSVVSLLGAERGFLLLADGKLDATGPIDPAQMKVRVARSFDKSDVPIPSSRLSMGIAGRVVEKGRPLLSVDAGRDDRFSGMASVDDLRLRSVLCLPITIDGRVEGVLYVDNRLQRAAFGEEDLDLVEHFAAQAAVAIRNARLVSELRQRNQRLAHSGEQIRLLNEQLGRKVRDRDSELAVVRASLSRERGRHDYSAIVGASDAMRRLFQELDRVTGTELSVLIQGESGTGKELIARAIHFNGPRKDRPFVAENCAALPDSLLESELFGHTRGAFTGADRAKKGLIEQAHTGTLLLDEIGDMSNEMQKKLLRVLQDGEVRALGSNERVKVDVRILAASHRDLEQLVRSGGFREDLFYRLNVITLRLPALRERREDIPLLAEALLARSARETGRAPPALAHEVLATLSAYDWPGNVRELENEMRRVLLLADGVVLLEHLSPPVLAGRAAPAAGGDEPGQIVGDLRGSVARYERTAIENALTLSAGNKSRAAQSLGISRFALQRKLDKYGLGSGEGEGRADDALASTSIEDADEDDGSAA
jgi:transcriptional regulator with GAF, ATPase, and Fis domain